MAESSGNPGAVNPNNPNGTIDRGLWQINSIHEHRLKGGNWFDPADSTRMAREIYADAGNSWTPWSTYSHWGTNTAHLQAARASIAKGIGPVPGNPGTGVKGNDNQSLGNPDGLRNSPQKSSPREGRDEEGRLHSASGQRVSGQPDAPAGNRNDGWSLRLGSGWRGSEHLPDDHC